MRQVTANPLEIEMSRTHSAALAVLLSLVATPMMAETPRIQFYSEGGAAKPFSAAVRIGDMVYTSGAIGEDSNGTLPTDFAAQATNAMQAVSHELRLANASMDDVFKCDISLSNIRNWAAFNLVYVTFFRAGHLPVRMASGANGLAKGASVEVECQAYTRR